MPVLTDPQGWFTLQVPNGWDMATKDGVTTLRRPGAGLVYLSGARHSRGRQASFGGAEVHEVDGMVRSVRLYHSAVH